MNVSSRMQTTPNTHGVEVHGAADQQAQRRAHGAKVRAEIDHIGDDQQENDGAKKPR